MRTAARIALPVVAVAALAVAIVALVQLHSTRGDLRALQRRVGRPSAGQQQPTTLAARVSQLETQESFDVGNLKDQIDAIGNVCPTDVIRNYYTRLLGEQDAGVDVSVYLNLMDAICPDAVGNLTNQRNG